VSTYYGRKGGGGGARSGACLLDLSLEALDLRSGVRGREAEGKRERGGRAVAPEQRRAVRAEQREGSGGDALYERKRGDTCHCSYQGHVSQHLSDTRVVATTLSRL